MRGSSSVHRGAYWLPAIWQEMNPFRYFENRVKKTVSALADMREQLGHAVDKEENVTGSGRSRRSASASESLRIDRLHLHGSSLRRGGDPGLASCRCFGISGPARRSGWEGRWPADPRQKKEVEEAYARRLTECLAAGFEALAPGGFASVTFANKDPRVWEALLGACAKVGFVLKSRTRMAPSAPNLTNILSEGAPKEDAILSFQKPVQRGR